MSLARTRNSHYTIPAFAEPSAGRPALTRFGVASHVARERLWQARSDLHQLQSLYFSALISLRIGLWDWLDSNQRTSGYEPPALTTELQSRLATFIRFQLENVDKSCKTPFIHIFSGAWGQNRTVDTRIFSPLLYH